MSIAGKVFECKKCGKIEYGEYCSAECECGCDEFIELPEEIIEEREREEFEKLFSRKVKKK